MRGLGLALLLLASLNGCASGINGALKRLAEHPDHCIVAAEIIRAAAQEGKVPKDATVQQIDQVLHGLQLLLYLGGQCPMP